ncbi:stalk domain-containing protein [Paenibacillus sp. LPE1-1-1.1]|uniref:stalk domain-containing protein n=1 Tax=Paenibacillus sp. LPE1-1-1.1 TaxID=3135230 RepID=UPI00341ADF1F
MTPIQIKQNKSLKRKRKLAAALTASMLLSTAPAAGLLPGADFAAAAEGSAAAASMLNVVSQPFLIDGMRTEVPTAIVDGETYISLRVLNEKLGLATSWDVKSRSAVVTGRNRVFIASPVNGSYELNGQRVYGSQAILNNGSTFLPLRFLLERMGYVISYDADTRTVDIQTIKENTLNFATKTISEVTEKQSLLIHYPVISGYENADTQSKVNAFLKREAESFTVSGQQSLTKTMQENEKLQSDNPDIDYPPVAYEGNYTITYNEQDMLSLYVDYYIDLGGAHGTTVRIPYTFDLKNGDTVSLKEAAGSHSDYVAIINQSINAQIKARKLNLLNPFEGIKPDRPFYLRHGAIVITFEQYEYTAYAQGMPEFMIPFRSFE